MSIAAVGGCSYDQGRRFEHAVVVSRSSGGGGSRITNPDTIEG